MFQFLGYHQVYHSDAPERSSRILDTCNCNRQVSTIHSIAIKKTVKNFNMSICGIKTNWCHYFNFIYILPDLYMFRAHRPILRRVHTAVHTTIGSVSVLLWPCALTEHTARAGQILNQWLCEQLCELSWGWACGPETCRDPAIYK